MEVSGQFPASTALIWMSLVGLQNCSECCDRSLCHCWGTSPGCQVHSQSPSAMQSHIFIH